MATAMPGALALVPTLGTLLPVLQVWMLGIALGLLLPRPKWLRSGELGSLLPRALLGLQAALILRCDRPRSALELIVVTSAAQRPCVVAVRGASLPRAACAPSQRRLRPAMPPALARAMRQ